MKKFIILLLITMLSISCTTTSTYVREERPSYFSTCPTVSPTLTIVYNYNTNPYWYNSHFHTNNIYTNHWPYTNNYYSNDYFGYNTYYNYYPYNGYNCYYPHYYQPHYTYIPQPHHIGNNHYYSAGHHRESTTQPRQNYNYNNTPRTYSTPRTETPRSYTPTNNTPRSYTPYYNTPRPSSSGTYGGGRSTGGRR
jgi:hypothetical protein